MEVMGKLWNFFPEKWEPWTKAALEYMWHCQKMYELYCFTWPS